MDTAAFEQVYGSFRDFHAYFAPLFARRETREHSGHYLQALLVQSGERRNAENLSETVPGSARGMQRFLTDSPWDDEVIIGQLQEYLGTRLEHPEGVWALDGSDFPKQGRKSVGVSRQYCGRMGKVANCQAGMFLAYVSPLARGWVKSASSKVPSSSPQEKDPSPTNAADQQQGILREAPSRTRLRRMPPIRTARGTNSSDARTQTGRHYRRRQEQERRQKAKECGQCRDCKNLSIPGKTRCEVCAARHRMSGKQARERKAQQQEQISRQDPIS